MKGSEEQQRLFVTRGRPAATVLSAIVFGIAAAVSDDARYDWFLVVLVVAVVATQVPAFAALARGARTETVARGVLLSDIVMVGGLTAALDSENLLVVAFFAPVAFAASMFGPRFTLLLTALAGAAVVVVGVVFIEASTLTIAADLLVLVATGGILAGLSREIHTAQGALARERAWDQTALALSERIRSSLDVERVLTATLEELGRTLSADRTVLRLTTRGFVLYQWVRPGVPLLTDDEPPPAIREVIETGVPLVARNDGEIPGELAAIGAKAIVAYPVRWQGRVVAVLGCTSAEPRDWNEEALPLLQRLGPQIGAALAQAELYEQQQATLDEFRELSRLREELVANVSHELRTPLTSTIGFLQTIQRRSASLSEEQRMQFVELALREAERLGRLVDDLLDLARLERGVLSLALGPTELRAVVERAKLGLDLDGRELRIDLDPELVARGDPDRLLQVFSNLLGNAIQHGAGTVTVNGEDGGRHVTVTISDGGTGIPAERMSELFVPFAHWGAHGDSTGLGLAISRGIVHAHGGTLYYRPAGDGSEHAFVVTLPRDGATPAPVPARGTVGP